MAWRKVVEADLTARLSVQETEAFRRSVDFTDDALAKQIAGVVAKVRGHIRATGTVAIDPDESTLPESLISDAMNYLRYELLTRFDKVPNEARRAAWDSARQTFESVAKGEIAVESSADATNIPIAPSISVKPPIL